ncbi:GTP cyclohydrolase [Pseudomonas sp. ATCC 13867]|uniref:GTP cyclohydrolase FolE2 n=1 Tax=Pseudomonas sp. ATCC 13867 TaxID=1294143 RepID=UPI0002C4F5FD|nr:GTP cyclohydrolase FolE2 [Pseudomonas sp. ATCC 13867]AGI22107.1 GTP cyclohydrolase [Pseudomonas sp. ATCC 13867]RFQ33680.1 GTP cyclohydrolase I FolE2 [Pseudomonas sp. ATCC 13867]
MTALLPDIACQSTHLPVPLDWVGMQGIAVPLRIAGERVAAYADAGVSLDEADARGIHMSRLYLELEALADTELSPALLRDLLRQFLRSHAQLSRRASLVLRFELMLRRPALVSPLSGWKRYPCEIHAQLEDDVLQLELRLSLPYSSTCPCSAALARQLIQERFDADFAGRPLKASEVRAWLGSPQGILATPHSQRSEARLQLRLDPAARTFAFSELIDHAEAALGTAVQTAVKRADEQAFALANGQNLMFCEDAARRLHRALLQREEVSGFEVRVVHAESLHAHDAVAASRWVRP